MSTGAVEPAETSEILWARAGLSRLLEPNDGPAAALNRILGPRKMLRVIQGRERIQSAQEEAAAECLSAETSLRWRGLDESLARWRTRLAALDPQRDLDAIHRLGGGLLIPEALGWPHSLNDLGLSAPQALWYLGNRPPKVPAAEHCIAVVGSRDCTGYGRTIAYELATGLAEAGLTVISGGAYGIDGAAHRAALAARASPEKPGLPTIAVMAGGLDRWYPQGNEELLREVRSRGLLLSEVPVGTAPSRYRFLQRNRLIAALSAAVVVVEARWRSGALNTAHHALALGRQVGAVPGRVDLAHSAGCHRLLREGAVCVTDAAEAAELSGSITRASGLAEQLRREQPSGQRAQAKRSERRVHDGLATEDLMIFDALPARRGFVPGRISELSGLPMEKVRAGLGRLELLGLACQVNHADGRRWRKLERDA
ncbi:DNA-processing protein DprA [Acaricomes phytoseiuli]|uniref:DNA-processing protein DprA n=1 Tax=Acaricomes phytoseiuli TaxID=291968 RepID=UPI000375FACB|nr:DNA-processing protein DprA [Acaricomes phytoseiuli]MCW1250449.1 DNA-processing protein DprA [Acaricomes phytoseiuli]